MCLGQNRVALGVGEEDGGGNDQGLDGLGLPLKQAIFIANI